MHSVPCNIGRMTILKIPVEYLLQINQTAAVLCSQLFADRTMGFVTPFKTFEDGYQSQNPLVLANDEYTKAGKTPVSWNFTTMPSEEWKNGVGSALLEYAQGTGDWDAVVTAFVDGWKTEYDAAHAE